MDNRIQELFDECMELKLGMENTYLITLEKNAELYTLKVYPHIEGKGTNLVDTFSSFREALSKKVQEQVSVDLQSQHKSIDYLNKMIDESVIKINKLNSLREKFNL